jgi:FAD/FMN-containing dehydrogenase
VLGRAHGLTCDALVGALVVLADGCLVDCDSELEQELFWALRGAAGGRAADHTGQEPDEYEI